MIKGTQTYRSVARLDKGVVRPYNEDAYLERADMGLWVVADGMGGHKAGDVASKMIVDSLGDIDSPEDGRQFLNDVRDCLEDVNGHLFEHGAGRSRDATMGSTVVALLIFDDFFAGIWAGDSRLYRYRDKNLEQLSEDHSYVQDQIRKGILTEGEDRTHPMRNVITRAVGAGADLDLDTCHGPIEPGDLFFICTDGVHGVLDDEDIADFLDEDGLDVAADLMVRECLARGAPDNLTLVIIQSGPVASA